MQATTEVAAAVICKGNKVLLAFRPIDKPPCGWEFPDGKLEPNETVQEALRRELREEIGIDSYCLDEIYRTRVGKILLRFIRVFPKQGAIPVALEGQRLKWFDFTEDAPTELLSGDLKFWKFLKNFSKLKNKLPSNFVNSCERIKK